MAGPSQSMSKTVIQLLVQRERFTIYAYFETSHGNSKSDGLVSVVKFYVSREVAANELIIRNGRDISEFCVATFIVVEGKGKMLSRHFICLKEEDLEAVGIKLLLSLINVMAYLLESMRV